MRSIQLSAAVITASFFLTLSGAQSATPSDAESPHAPKSSSSSTVQNATAFDLLVGAAEAGNVDAMNLLGVLYTVGTQVPRDYSLAIRWFQKAADTDPSWGKPLFKLALVQLNKGDKDATIKALEKVIAADPMSSEAAQAKQVIEQLKK